MPNEKVFQYMFQIDLIELWRWTCLYVWTGQVPYPYTDWADFESMASHYQRTFQKWPCSVIRKETFITQMERDYIRPPKDDAFYWIENIEWDEVYCIESVSYKLNLLEILVFRCLDVEI